MTNKKSRNIKTPAAMLFSHFEKIASQRKQSQVKFKAKNENTSKILKICSQLTIKKPKRH